MRQPYQIIARERVRHFEGDGEIDSYAIDNAVDLLNGVLEYVDEGFEGFDYVPDEAADSD